MVDSKHCPDLPGLDNVYVRTVKQDSDNVSVSSDDPALMVVPRGSRSVSGVSRYRDFIRGLPVHLAKRILGLLDKASLRHCKDVSKHWRYLMGDTQKDRNCRKILEKQAMLMQSNITAGVCSTYANVREVLVPIMDHERHVPHEDILSNIRWERGFAATYAGIRTRAVLMEERNVFCGVYNILLLLDRDDSSRVVHYDGGQLVAVGSKDRVVRLLDVATLTEVNPVIQGHAGSIRALLLCEEKELVISASYDLSIRCWSLKTGACMMLLRGHLGTINCLDLHGNCLVSGARDCKVKVWNLQTGKCYEKLKFKHHDPILCVKIDKARVLSSCQKGLVKMWSMEKASLLKTIDAHRSSVRCLFFDQWHILSGSSDGEVMACSTSCDMKNSLMIYHHPKEVLALILLFLRVITGCGDGKIRIFNFLTGDCLRVIKAGGQHSPILSLHTHNNNVVVNTPSGVLLYRFTEVRWDHSVPAEREHFNESRGIPGSVLDTHKCPHARVRAGRMMRVGSSNRKIYNRADEEPETPALSHHARALSAPSMRRAYAVQQESMRPATWSELQSYRRSQAYIDLQPEFISEHPSAITPATPVSGHCQDPQTRTLQTPRSHTSSMARDPGVIPKWLLTPSEMATKARVKKRGPHHNVTPDRILLSVNSIQRTMANDQAGLNMEFNARVRDAWGSPPPLFAPPQGTKPGPQTFPSPPAPKQSPLCKMEKTSSAPSHRAFRYGMTKTHSPLLTQALDLKLRHSLHSRELPSSTPSPAAVRPRTVPTVGPLATGAQSDVQEPGRVFLKMPGKRRGRHVGFVRPNENIGQYNPLDPFRVSGAFRLLTDSQSEDDIRSRTRQHGMEGSRTREDQEKHRKTWKMRMKGVSTTDYTVKDTRELGQDKYI
ncbi:hypothetical protein DPEC_G00359110 [Dallia pectoralis]|uniref:Uncharacterized protein n=1 Tax=Dallia pectoralis TaxID=75939 RepID=A0ACC2F0I7_DALPE|nr:hypothetical protein DPEC_G00359110 [Dallia pectoralis]